MRSKAVYIVLFTLCCLAMGAQTTGELLSKAEMYYKSREYTKAANFYKETLNSYGADSDDAFIEAILRHYTQVLLNIGCYNDVDSLLSHHSFPNNFILLNNHASALGYLQEYDKALCLFKSILDLPNINEEDVGKIYQNMGFIYMDSGDFSNAEIELGKSMKYLTGANLLIAKSNLAMCKARLGFKKQALGLIDEAISGLQTKYPTYQEDYIICLRKKAEIYAFFNQKKESFSLFAKYFALNKQGIINRLNDLTYNERLNLWMKEKSTLSKCFLIGDFAPEFLYEVALFRRQTSLLGMHDATNLKYLLSAKPDDIQKQLNKSEVAIEFVTYPDNDGVIQYAAIILPQEGESRFVKLFDEKFLYIPEIVGTNSIVNAIKREDPLEKNILYSDTALADKVWLPIIENLPSSTTTIYFAPEGVIHFLGIENMPFTGRDKYEIYRVTSTASLLSETAKSSESPRTLLVGGLDYSMLPDDVSDGSYNHDASFLLKQKLGNSNEFRFLPGALAEVDSISTIVSNARTEHNVGEGRLKNEMFTYDIVHIATHGYNLNLGIRRTPEFATDSLAYDISLNACGLALSGANIAADLNSSEDGLLSAREICNLDLSNVDFVVLSACQTAQGNISDEGAAGLVRGLKNAGVNTVMATLWSVDDRSTMLFMQEFYRMLARGFSKHEAYIAAQNYLRNHSERVPVIRFSPRILAREKTDEFIEIKYDAPYYWAPFIIIDDF